MRRFPTWKRLSVTAIGLLALVALVPVVNLLAEYWQSYRTLAAVCDQLDRDDPGWRLDDIVTSTNAKLPPDDRNPFVVATAANDLLPADFRKRKRFEDFPKWAELEPNVLLNPTAEAKLLAAMRGMEPALHAARGLADLPEVGGNALVIPPNPTQRAYEKEHELKLTTALLRADAVLLAEEGKMGEAVRSVRAALGTARAMGDDPSLIGLLIRMNVAGVAGRAAERVMNLGVADVGLAELQAEFLKEAASPRLLVGLRGERAEAEAGATYLLPSRTLWRTDLACALDVLTQYVEAARLPAERQAAAFAAIITPPLRSDPRYALTTILLSGIDKVCAASSRSDGELSAVAVGIACERYRRRFGQWPATLADIPKDILATLPVDPCDGLPLKYKRLPGRVVIYSVGPDGVDHGGDLNDATPQAQRDYGIRLYDVAQRRQPAAPGATP